MKAWIGVDPGADGAVALLFEDRTLEIVEVKDGEAAVLAALEWWPNECDLRLVALEQVGAMPGQGVTSTFTFGRNYGWCQGVLDALKLPWKLVRPQEWQRGVVPSKPKGCKKRSTVAAERLWPGVKFRGPGGGLRSGRADAALIADWARRKG